MNAQDSASQPLLTVRNLTISYRVHIEGHARRCVAVNDVTFDLHRGRTLGIVGESGSGKSTIARALLRLIQVDSGDVLFRGSRLLELSGERLRSIRRYLQLIFQDPLASLDPRMQIEDIVAEPLRIAEPDLGRRACRERVVAITQAVGLAPEHLHRYPHEFSGGQAQRIALARALIARPELVVCDEPLSALDVSIKSQISNLLKDLQQQLSLSLLFISHDLLAVRFLCDRVLVLYLGRVMEIADGESLFTQPRHPYTRALLRSAPIPDPAAARARRHEILEGEVPSLFNTPSGCVFRTRCPFAIERCRLEVPQLRDLGASRVACHRADDIPRR
jgi:oligopeptide transport system ATP-binding protein